MSTVIPIILEAETISAREYIAGEYMRATTMREEELRAAMRAAAQASLAQKTALRQEPGRQGSGRQDSDLASLGVADSGRVVRVGGGSRRPDPRVVDPNPHVAGSTQVGGDLATNNSQNRSGPPAGGSRQVSGGPVTNNPLGRAGVTMVGRSRPTKPMQSGKSKIVPEPDQIQSAPPVRPTLPHRT